MGWEVDGSLKCDACGAVILDGGRRYHVSGAWLAQQVDVPKTKDNPRGLAYAVIACPACPASVPKGAGQLGWEAHVAEVHRKVRERWEQR